jgi:hypothetical protein
VIYTSKKTGIIFRCIARTDDNQNYPGCPYNSDRPPQMPQDARL